MPDPRPSGPLTMVDRQRDLRPCYVQNGSILVAGASAKDNEDHDQSSTVPATGWISPGFQVKNQLNAGGSHRLSRRAATVVIYYCTQSTKRM